MSEHHPECYGKILLLEQMLITMQKEYNLLNERIEHLTEHILHLEKLVERGCEDSKN
jgi:hypothetical protein